MTVENCLKLLKTYKFNSENLSGGAKAQSKLNYEMMKTHILGSTKFAAHPILLELMPKPSTKKKKVK